tara:strand:+ start:1265 stop:1495 length:231 start_codon:yes stop_codon:yes gene_type:complete
MNRQQDVDKHAKIAMLIISSIIIFLFIIALSGCINKNVNDSHIGEPWPEDSMTDSVYIEYFGKEGKSEYGEYEPNE